jgi:hypothetical protein
MHRHISHGSQKNKPHSRAKAGGKVENTAPRNLASTSSGELGKEERWNKQVQLRKNKREDLLMKRRGLNFVTDQHEMNLDEDCIDTMEKEIDNIAPKVIAILGLSATCDTSVLKE